MMATKEPEIKVVITWLAWSSPVYEVKCADCGALLNRLDNQSKMERIEAGWRAHSCRKVK